jgi:hypothetical protein
MTQTQIPPPADTAGIRAARVVEDLEGASCLELVPPVGVGRYLTEEDGSPFLPVEYRIDGSAFLLRVPSAHDVSIVGSGRAPERGIRATIIIHGEASGPWTVSVRGCLVPMTDPARLQRLEHAPSAWGDDARSGRWFEVRALSLEGHRIVRLPAE